jgi:hypothetical protein
MKEAKKLLEDWALGSHINITITDVGPDFEVSSSVSSAPRIHVVPGEEWIELLVDGEVPGFPINLKAPTKQQEHVFLEVLKGHVAIYTFPLWRTVKIGTPAVWKGTDFNLHVRLGAKRFSPYGKKNN